MDTARVLDRSVEYVIFLEDQLMRLAADKGGAILAEFAASSAATDARTPNFGEARAPNDEEMLDQL